MPGALVAIDCVEVPAVPSPVGTQGGNPIRNRTAIAFAIASPLAAVRIAAKALVRVLQAEIRVLAAARRAFLCGSEWS